MPKPPKRVPLARSMRKQPVPAEARLWKALRNRALAQFKFRRQHPVSGYVVDFACVGSRLVIEVDGESHLDRAAQTRDTKRTEALEAAGWKVLRFWNTEIYDHLGSVKELVYRTCVERADRRPPPSP